MWKASSGLLILLLSSLFPSASNTGREQKYYNLKELSIGRLTLSNARVSLVGVKPKLDVDGFEDVPVLNLDRADISIKASDGTSAIMTAVLAEGSTVDPAGSLSGRFKWKGNQIDVCELTVLRLRVKQATLTADEFGHNLLIQPATTVFLNSTTPITSSAANSTLSIIVPRSELKDSAIRWRGLSFPAQFKSEGNSTFSIELSSAAPIRVISALYSIATISQEISLPLDDFLPDAVLTSGTALLEKIKLAFDHAHPSLTVGRLTVQKPEMTIPSRNNLKVDAAEEALVTELRSDASIKDGQVTTSDGPLEFESFSVLGDPNRVIQSLNNSGHLTADTLLPTGNPDARFVRTSAQVAFYKGLSQGSSASQLTNIKISGSNHIIDKIDIGKVDLALDIAGKLAKDPSLPKILCSVAVDGAAAKGAGRITTSLINLAYQSRSTITIATWLELSNKMSPELGSGGAYHLARVMNFPQPNGAIVKVAASHVAPGGDPICEVLLAGPGVPPSVVTGLYKPQIMQSLSQQPNEWDNVSVRYAALLDGMVRVILTPQQAEIYHTVTNNVAARTAFLANIVNDGSITNTADQAQYEKTRGDYDAQRKALLDQQMPYKDINDRAQAVPLEQARQEEAHKLGGILDPLGVVPPQTRDEAIKAVKQSAAAAVGAAIIPVGSVTNLIAGRTTLGDGARNIADSQSALSKAVGQAVSDTNSAANNITVVAAERIGGNAGKTVVTITTGPSRLSVDFAATVAILSPDILQGKQPLELQTLVAVPLAAAIRSAENQFKDSARPLPESVKTRLAGNFPQPFLNSAKWVIGSISITLPDLINQKEKIFEGRDQYAVTVGGITVFSVDPGDDFHWWAHELQHQVQYQQWGIDRFAFEYVRSCHAVESDAEVKAQAAVPINVEPKLGC